MAWYYVDLSPLYIAEGGYHRLCREFQKVFIAAGAPAEMALFAQKTPLEGRRKVFFSPGSVPYVACLINSLGGVPCNGPNTNEVTLVFGIPGAQSELLPVHDATTTPDGLLRDDTALPIRLENPRSRKNEFFTLSSSNS